jgi:hypothetical protein
MKFKLEIDCGNAAFGSDSAARYAEVGRILAEIAKAMRDESLTIPKVRDSNGNVVGKASFTGK